MMNDSVNGDSVKLLRLVPQVLRARGWRLYTQKGRLVDLWQSGGASLLGHNPPALLRELKNSGERGLFAPLPHFAEGRLLKALAVLFPRREFRLYPERAALLAALSGAGLAGTSWRPFLDEAAPGPDGAAQNPEEEAALVPVLPFPFPGAPAVLVLAAGSAERFPPPPPLSPLTLAAAARCVWNLCAAPDRGKPRFPRIEKALTQNRFWRRRGIYLFHDYDYKHPPAADYGALFRRFLDAGFLLPPVEEEPAILPGELSPGEEAKLAGLLGDS